MNQTWIDKAKNAGQSFEKPVSEELWIRVQKDHSLQAKRKRLYALWAKRASIAVAASIAAFVCVSLPWNQNHEDGIEEPQASDACVMYVNGVKIDDETTVIAQMRGELDAIGSMSDIAE